MPALVLNFRNFLVARLGSEFLNLLVCSAGSEFLKFLVVSVDSEFLNLLISIANSVSFFSCEAWLTLTLINYIVVEPYA